MNAKLVTPQSDNKDRAVRGTIQLTGPNLPCVTAEDLFGQHREILIEHAGVHYRLRITRANKLILTK